MKIGLLQRNYLAEHCHRVMNEAAGPLACDSESMGPDLKEPANEIACMAAILSKVGWQITESPSDWALRPEGPVILGSDDPIMPLAQVQAWVRRFIVMEETSLGIAHRNLEVADLEREHPEQPRPEEVAINLRLGSARLQLAIGQSLLCELSLDDELWNREAAALAVRRFAERQA